jgi:hypothetical protein
MKKLVVILMFALIGVSAGVSADKYSPEYLKRARQNYLVALNAENPGLRADAIFQVLKFKVRYPDENFRPFIKKFEKMCQHEDCLQNRLHAYLARTFLETKNMAQQIDPHQFDDAKSFFAQFYEKLNSERLALE